MSKPLILVVEDDVPVRNLITITLKTHGYRYLTAGTGDGAVIETSSHNPDVVLLDLGLPDMDGVDVIRKIRTWSNLPIIVISARSEDTDKIDALDAGADDYLTKPFGVMELVSRTKAVLRRTAKKVKTVLVYKNIEIDENKHTVLVDGAEIDLTYKEYEILKHLIRNKGIVLTRDRLMEIVWGYNFEQGNRTVDVHIQSLRKKLGAAGEHIKTIRNVGYKVGE